MGSLTVEAALVVPLVILLMLPFLYVIRSVYVYDCVHTAVCETAEMLEVLLYLSGKIPTGQEPEGQEPVDEKAEKVIIEQLETYQRVSALISEISGESVASSLIQNAALQQIAGYFIQQLLEDMQLEAWGIDGGMEGISYSMSDFFYEEEGHENLFKIIARYKPEFPFVKSFATLRPVSIQAVGRAYLGQDFTGDESGSGETETVWYRIGSGNHYHTADCYLIAKQTQLLPREEAIRRGYMACKACNSESSGLVIVSEGGERYHEKGCHYINPNTIPVHQKEIEEYGYLPCQICIGGGGWFG